MGVAAPLALVGSWDSHLPQKLDHGSLKTSFTKKQGKPN